APRSSSRARPACHASLRWRARLVSAEFSAFAGALDTWGNSVGHRVGRSPRAQGNPLVAIRSQMALVILPLLPQTAHILDKSGIAAKRVQIRIVKKQRITRESGVTRFL